MMLSSAAAWAVLRVEFPLLRENRRCRVAGKVSGTPGRGSGEGGGERALALDCEKRLLEKLDRGHQWGWVGAEEAEDAVRMEHFCCNKARAFGRGAARNRSIRHRLQVVGIRRNSCPLGHPNEGIVEKTVKACTSLASLDLLSWSLSSVAIVITWVWIDGGTWKGIIG